MKPNTPSKKSAALTVGGQARTSTKLVRKGPSPMALEQRFMFDGAAVDTAIVAAKPTADLLHFSTADTALPQAVLTARTDAQNLIAAYLAQPDARNNLFALFSGGQTTPSDQWNAALIN